MAVFNIDKFEAFVSKTPSKFHESVKYRSENRYWLKESIEIALKLNSVIYKKDISYEELSEKSSYDIDKIKSMLKGNYNFTLEEKYNLYRILDIKEKITYD